MTRGMDPASGKGPDLRDEADVEVPSRSIAGPAVASGVMSRVALEVNPVACLEFGRRDRFRPDLRSGTALRGEFELGTGVAISSVIPTKELTC